MEHFVGVWYVFGCFDVFYSVKSALVVDLFIIFVRSNFVLQKYHVNCFVRTRFFEKSFASISAFSVSSITSMSMLSWSPCIALWTCTQTSVIELNFGTEYSHQCQYINRDICIFSIFCSILTPASKSAYVLKTVLKYLEQLVRTGQFKPRLINPFSSSVYLACFGTWCIFIMIWIVVAGKFNIFSSWFQSLAKILGWAWTDCYCCFLQTWITVNL